MTDETASNTPDPSVPPPAFSDMPLSEDVKLALADMGYTHAAPVQQAVLEPASRRIDLVVQARTGTGKTAAFGIPLVDQLVKRTLAAPQALVLTPTRELALQVSREIDQIGSRRGVRTVAVYGGAPIQKQIDAIRGGAQIVVGTPGRVLDHLKRGTLDPSALRHLVLDEADEMLSMGFERELHAILEFLPKDRHTMLFSATLPPDIVRIASERLKQPQFLSLSGDQVGALDILHFVYFISQDKGEALVRILEVEDPESAIIFCNTRDETERVAGILSRAGFDADWLNGDLPQSEREQVMRRSKEGKLRYLVATDVAARGIDISHLTHVINYDFPESAEMYVHRTGRTGRMGRTGTAVSLITPQDIGNLYYMRLTYKIRPIEKQIPTAGELKTRAEADLIEMIAQGFASTPPHPDDLALARRLLTHDRCEEIIAGLLRSHLGERPRATELASAARRARAPRPAQDVAPVLPRTPRGRHRGAVRGRGQPEPVEAAEPPHAATTPGETSGQDMPPSPPSPSGAPGLPRLRERSRARRAEGAEVPSEPWDTMGDGEATGGANRSAAASIEGWTPPVEDNDDEPILGGDTAEAQDDSLGVEDGVELFVNVGRRDGARPGDFVRALCARGTVERDDIGRIRMRDRHTFVIVRRAALDSAIAAMSGARIGNRTVSAEIARPRDPTVTSE